MKKQIFLIILSLGMSLQAMNASLTNNQRLLRAAENGKWQQVYQLVGGGADVNFADAQGETPLIAASQKGYSAILYYLLKNGADIYHKNNAGKTALDVAKTQQEKNLLMREMEK